MSKWLSVLSLAVMLALFQGGLFRADAWSIPQGACCYPDGSCADDQYQSECETDGGTYMGDLTTCAQVECVAQPQGACCYPDASCADDQYQAQCETDGGTYMGDLTTCAQVECVAQPQGACCYPDASCADDQYQAQCEADGGTYMGDLTTCAQVECDPQAQGACCYADGSCADDLTRTECSGQGGVYMGDGTACFEVECDTDVRDETGDRGKPSQFALFQNHPNPFNQTTKIEFTLAGSDLVSLIIYDLLGRKVRTLASEHLPSGYKSVSWDGKNDCGEDVASGIYFYQLRVGDFSETKTLVLLK